MDLVCPTCQRKLTIDNRYAGMVVKCPLCNSNLQAPLLLGAAPPPVLPPAAPLVSAPAAPPPPVNPPAPPSVPSVAPVPPSLPAAPPPAPLPAAEVIPAVPSPAAAPSPAASPPALDVAEVIAEPTPITIVRESDYRTSYRVHLRQDIVEWIAPVCVVAVFLLSLFPWYYHEAYAVNLWELAFTERGYAIYTFYTVVFVFLALPVTVVTFCLEKRWIPFPEGLRPYWRFRSLIVGGLIGVPFLFFLGDYISFQFLPFGIQASIAMKLAFRLHLLAVIGCALQFWLELRKAANLPAPRLTLRW